MTDLTGNTTETGASSGSARPRVLSEPAVTALESERGGGPSTPRGCEVVRPGQSSWCTELFQQRETRERASRMRLADTQWRRPAVRRELNRRPQSPGRGHSEDASGGVSVRNARSWDQSWRNASVWSSRRETEAEEETGSRFQLRLPDFW